MKAVEIRDALNNAGLPQLAIKVFKDDAPELTEDDRKVIKARIEDFDNYYRKGWKESNTRWVLKTLIGE